MDWESKRWTSVIPKLTVPIEPGEHPTIELFSFRISNTDTRICVTYNLQMFEISKDTSTLQVVKTNMESIENFPICAFRVVTTSNNNVYLIGGHGRDGHVPSKKMYRLQWKLGENNELTINAFVVKTNLKSPRMYFGACAVGNVIYVLGGYGAAQNRKPMSSAEAFNFIDTDNPTIVKLPNGRKFFDTHNDNLCQMMTLTSVGSKLVLVTHGHSYIYDTENNTCSSIQGWYKIPVGTMHYMHSSVCLYDRFLIVMGGDDRSTVEYLDLDKPLGELEWIRLPDMAFPRCYSSSVVLYY